MEKYTKEIQQVLNNISKEKDKFGRANTCPYRINEEISKYLVGLLTGFSILDAKYI